MFHIAQPLLDGRISEAEWLEDCELLQAAYDRNAVLQRLCTELREHTARQTSLINRLYSALALFFCCLCVLLDAKSELHCLTADVYRQRQAVLTAYVDTMCRKYQYRQLNVSVEHDVDGASWLAVRLEQTTTSDGEEITEEARLAARHARSRSHQRRKSASMMGESKRILSASSKVQVHPYLPPAIVLPVENEEAEGAQQAEVAPQS